MDSAAIKPMKDVLVKIRTSDIFLDETIYPRENIDHKRIGIFVENPKQAILIVDYYEIFKKTGWTLTHIIQAPLSSERFNPGVVAAMQKKKILGVTSRYVMILK